MSKYCFIMKSDSDARAVADLLKEKGMKPERNGRELSLDRKAAIYAHKEGILEVDLK